MVVTELEQTTLKINTTTEVRTCKRGHELGEDNQRWDGRRWRCRKCLNENVQANRAKFGRPSRSKTSKEVSAIKASGRLPSVHSIVGKMARSVAPAPEKQPESVLWKLYQLPASQAHLRGEAAIALIARTFQFHHNSLPTVILVHPENLCSCGDIVVRLAERTEPKLSETEFACR